MITIQVTEPVHRFFSQQRKRTGVAIHFAINKVLEAHIAGEKLIGECINKPGRSSGVESERVVGGTAGGKKLRGNKAGK